MLWLNILAPATKKNNLPHLEHIADIRQDYILASLDEGVTGNDPLAFFGKWFGEAVSASIIEVNAMTLASVDGRGFPHARIVLLKGVEHNGFTFFTNYNSAKGEQIAANNHVSLLFFWKELERQVRIEGIARQLSATESDTYFESRPYGSKLGAWASPQSQVIADREVINENYSTYLQQFKEESIPRPPHWGGYNVQPQSIEFWQGRSSRMHDRILFTAGADGHWSKCRLAP